MGGGHAQDHLETVIHREDCLPHPWSLAAWASHGHPSALVSTRGRPPSTPRQQTYQRETPSGTETRTSRNNTSGPQAAQRDGKQTCKASCCDTYV